MFYHISQLDYIHSSSIHELPSLISPLSPGVCTAAATVLIMCVVFFVYQRRNRKQYAPSSFVPRSVFSKQTSMDDMEKGSTYLGVHLFTYRELEEATNYFDSAKELGDGGFGTVYHGNSLHPFVLTHFC